MRMVFPSDMPIWEQLQRSSERKRVGRKHNKTIGPGRAKKQPSRDSKRAAAWRAYKEQYGLYMRGFRETLPKRPDES